MAKANGRCSGDYCSPTLVDRSNNYKDVPNDYVELELKKEARYIRYKHISLATPNLAISDIRVFGNGSGPLPQQVKSVDLKRHKDGKDIQLKWDKIAGSQGYNVLWGIAPDKLYSSWMVYGDNSLLLKSLNSGQKYYFAIEAFNENGLSKLSKIYEVQ